MYDDNWNHDQLEMSQLLMDVMYLYGKRFRNPYGRALAL